MKIITVVSVAIATAAGALSGASPAQADATSSQIVEAISVPGSGFLSADIAGSPAGVSVQTIPIASLPTKGSSFLIVSNGDATKLLTQPSTNLGTHGGVDGNDLTQVTVHTKPPAGANCVSFEFVFYSAEYPYYVGSEYNDIFTAELNESQFDDSSGQVVAPHNFAFDSKGNPLSVNTVFGMDTLPASAGGGVTQLLTASSPVKKRPDGSMDVILSVQDIGDSVVDSAALIDNLRFSTDPTCDTGAEPVQEAGTATVAVKGAFTSSYSAQLSKQEIQPNSSAPVTIALESKTGEPVLTTDLHALASNPKILIGKIVFLHDGVAEPATLFATWKESTRTLSGTWVTHNKPQRSGKITIKVEAPTSAS